MQQTKSLIFTPSHLATWVFSGDYMKLRIKHSCFEGVTVRDFIDGRLSHALEVAAIGFRIRKSHNDRLWSVHDPLSGSAITTPKVIKLLHVAEDTQVFLNHEGESTNFHTWHSKTGIAR